MKITRKEATDIILQNNQFVIDNYSSECGGMCTLSSMLCLVDNIYDSIPQWISVEDKLPKSLRNKVLVIDNKNNYYIAYYDKGWEEWININDSHSIRNITHWMSLPQPFKNK